VKVSGGMSVSRECTLHNFIVLAIFVPKIVKVGGKLTKLWRKQFWLFLLGHGVNVNGKKVISLQNKWQARNILLAVQPKASDSAIGWHCALLILHLLTYSLTYKPNNSNVVISKCKWLMNNRFLSSRFFVSDLHKFLTVKYSPNMKDWKCEKVKCSN